MSVHEQLVRMDSWHECEAYTYLYLAMVWRRIGHPMKIPAAGEDQKLTVLGTVDYASGQAI